jgi:YD repeat-containing protein
MQTYSYDSDGKLISAKDGDAQSSVTYVTGTHRPQSYTTPGGLTHTLTYNANHLPATDTVADLVTANTYNPAGSLTKQEVKSTQNAFYLETDKIYSSDYHYLTSSTDANGVSAAYAYNSQRNLQNTQTGTDDIQRYSYYTGSDRLNQTYINGKASVTYTYGNGALTQLQRKSYIENDNLIVEVSDIPTDSQLTIMCSGSNIEMDALRIINEDIVSIISDLPIKTIVKQKIDSIMFSKDFSIKKKRIEIRKMANGKNWIERKYIDLFLKLLEYIKEV